MGHNVRCRTDYAAVVGIVHSWSSKNELAMTGSYTRYKTYLGSSDIVLFCLPSGRGDVDPHNHLV